MPIIISKNGQDAKKVEKSNFQDENYLQNYIHKNPDSIPLYDIKDDIRLLVLAREYPTNSGPIDAIGIDQSGEIYIVETKLYKNADKRRVIAQALDYGAALWKHANNFNEFLKVIDKETQKQWQINSRDKIKEFFHIDDEETEDIITNIEENLNDGKFKFVILMDQLDSRLKDLILYVNQNSQFDIYAVEFSFYEHASYEIIIPKLFGAEVKKDIAVSKSSGNSRKKWDEDSFFNEIKNTLNSHQISLVKDLYHFSKEISDTINWGTGSKNGSFSVVIDKISHRSIYTLSTNGDLNINFGWLDEGISTRYRDLLYKKLEELNLIPTNKDITKYWHTITNDEWTNEIDKFKQVILELKNLDL